jgi:hypothetical protein
MKTYGGGVIAVSLLTSTLDGGEWSASRSVGPSAGLDVIEEMKISWPNREMNPDSSVVQPVA